MATKRIKGALELLGWVLLFSFLVSGYKLYSYLTVMLFDPRLKEYPGWFVTVAWAERTGNYGNKRVGMANKMRSTYINNFA